MDTCTEFKRIIDDELDMGLHVFGAVLIQGPRGCGKAYAAKRQARSSLDFRDEERKQIFMREAQNTPSLLLKGDNPRLFVEWQNAPRLWDSVRKSVDARNQKGLYILTGQSPEFHNVQHPGIGRYSMLTMWPASLYESGESNGKISLGALLDNPDELHMCKSDLSVTGLIDCMCRGGWPKCVLNSKDAKEYIGSLLEKTYWEDVPALVGGHKRVGLAEEIVRFYSRNIGQSPRDMGESLCQKCGVSRPTLSSYVSALKQLYITEDIPPFQVKVRDSTHRCMSRRCNVADPSLAAYMAGESREDLNTDYDLLCRLFECLCYRELKVYSAARFSNLYYYRDRLGLEVDCVLNYGFRKYALIDFCFGQAGVEQSAKNLCKLEMLIDAVKKKYGPNDECLEYPMAKIILTGTSLGYRRKDGVLVVPVGCLKD